MSEHEALTVDGWTWVTSNIYVRADKTRGKVILRWGSDYATDLHFFRAEAEALATALQTALADLEGES